MSQKTSRQKILYISAKLYELAAEFSQLEFDEMLREGLSPTVRRAISALAALHETTGTSIPDRAVRHTEPRNDASLTSILADLFQDRRLFPTVGSIAAVVGVPPREKESRGRYLSRIAGSIENMKADQRKEFLKSLRERVPAQQNKFIAKWSRVIGEL